MENMKTLTWYVQMHVNFRSFLSVSYAVKKWFVSFSDTYWKFVDFKKTTVL